MTGHDANVDWARVHHLRGCGMSAAEALEQVKAEYAEQGGIIDESPNAPSAAESALTNEEHKAFHSKTCSVRSAVTWVASSLGTQPKLVDAPSPAAWNLYCWAAASHLNRSDFVRSLWSKLIPSQSELANEGRFSDDSRGLIEMIEQMIAEGRPSRTVNGTVGSRG